MALEFYTAAPSRGAIVRWMLEELGVEYETHVLEYGTSMKSPEYLAINPMGKVPCVVHDGSVITEGGAICAYLADAFPERGLSPPIGSKLRGPYFRWMFFAAGPIEAAITDKVMGLIIPDERKRSVGYGNFDDTMMAAGHALDNGPFILGESFSAADVYFGSAINYGLQFGMIAPTKTFENYVNSLREREAFIRAAQKDAQLLQKT